MAEFILQLCSSEVKNFLHFIAKKLTLRKFRSEVKEISILHVIQESNLGTKNKVNKLHVSTNVKYFGGKYHYIPTCRQRSNLTKIEINTIVRILY